MSDTRKLARRKAYKEYANGKVSIPGGFAPSEEVFNAGWDAAHLQPAPARPRFGVGNGCSDTGTTNFRDTLGIAPAPTEGPSALTFREWLCQGGGGFEDGEDGIRAGIMPMSDVIELVDEYLAARPSEPGAEPPEKTIAVLIHNMQTWPPHSHQEVRFESACARCQIEVMATSSTSAAAKERNKHKEVCDMLREMALEKPDMKLSVAASILLGVLLPITEADKKRGREIQEILDRAAAMRDDKEK